MQSQTGRHTHPEDGEPELGAFATHGDIAPNIGAHHENTGLERLAERHMPGAFDTGDAHHRHHHSRGGANTGDVIAESLRNEGKDTQREYRHEAGLAGATHAGSTVGPNTMGGATGQHHQHHVARDAAIGASVAGLGAHEYNKHEQHQSGVGGVDTGTGDTMGPDGRLVHPPGEHTRDDHGREHHAHHGHAGRDVAGGALAAGVAGHEYNKHQQHKEHEREMEVRDGHLGKHEKLPAGTAGADMHGGHHGGHHHHGPESRNLAENTALAGAGIAGAGVAGHEYNKHKEHKAEREAERAAQQGDVNRPETLMHDGRHTGTGVGTAAGVGAGAMAIDTAGHHGHGQHGAAGGRRSLDGDATERSPNDGSVPAQAVREEGMTAEDRKMRASMKAMGISKEDWVADKFTPAPKSPTSPTDGRRDGIPGRRISHDMGTSPSSGRHSIGTAAAGAGATGTDVSGTHVPGTGSTVPGTGEHVGGTGVGGAGVGGTGVGGTNVGTGVDTGVGSGVGATGVGAGQYNNNHLPATAGPGGGMGATPAGAQYNNPVAGGGIGSTGQQHTGTGQYMSSNPIGSVPGSGQAPLFGVNDPSMLNRSNMASGDNTTLHSGTTQQPIR